MLFVINTDGLETQNIISEQFEIFVKIIVIKVLSPVI
mgnify:CR=1 FL=1